MKFYIFLLIYSLSVFLIPTIKIGIPLRVEDLLILIYIIFNLNDFLKSFKLARSGCILLSLIAFFLFISLYNYIIFNAYVPSIADANSIFMIIKSILIYVIGISIGFNTKFDKSLLYISFGIIISAIIALIQYFNFLGLGNLLYLIYGSENKIEYGISRAIGTIGNPNYASYFFLNFFIIGLLYLKKYNKIILILPVLASVLTFSRTGIVSLAFIILIFLIYSNFKVIYKLLCSSILLISLFFIPSTIFQNTRIEVLSQNNEIFDSTLGGRSTMIWDKRLDYFYDNPLLGIGTGKNIKIDSNFEFTVFDNSILYIVVTSGIIGLILYLLFFLDLFKLILNKKLKKTEKSYILMYFTIMLIFFLTTDLIKNIFFISFNMLVFGLLMANELKIRRGLII